MRFPLSLPILWLTWACSDPPRDLYDPLSEACEACLSTAPEGCNERLSECESLSACEDYVYCQLRAGCYRLPAGSGCESRVGCELSSAAGSEAQQAAEAFEQCARTDCSKACGFVEP